MTQNSDSAKIQTAAIKALSNSLEFCRDNFNSKDERDHIMMVRCNRFLCFQKRTRAGREGLRRRRSK